MPSYNTSVWPVASVSAVCASQTTSGAGALLLNGTLANSNLPSQISFIDNGFIRSVSLTSTSNLSSITFTISGIQNGAFVTENITGPNNNTVYGTQYYDAIISVVSNAAVGGAGIQVGTGNKGYLPLVQISNSNTNGYINYSVSVILPAGSGLTYSLLQTLDLIYYNWIALQNQTSLFSPSMGLTNMTTTGQGNSTIIVTYLLLNISASTTPLTDTLTFIFAQA